MSRYLPYRCAQESDMSMSKYNDTDIFIRTNKVMLTRQRRKKGKRDVQEARRGKKSKGRNRKVQCEECRSGRMPAYFSSSSRFFFQQVIRSKRDLWKPSRGFGNVSCPQVHPQKLDNISYVPTNLHRVPVF